MGPQNFSDNAETLHLASTDLVVTQFRAFAKSITEHGLTLKATLWLELALMSRGLAWSPLSPLNPFLCVHLDGRIL